MAFLDAYAALLQLYVYQWQTIHKYAYIVTVGVPAVPHLVLVDYLCAIGMDVVFLYQVNVPFLAIVAFQGLHEVGLYGPRLVYDALALGGYFRFEEAIPLVVGEAVVVQLSLTNL